MKKIEQMPSADEIKESQWYKTDYSPGHGPEYDYTNSPEEKWTKVDDPALLSIKPDLIGNLIQQGKAHFSKVAMEKIIEDQKKFFHGIEIDEKQAICNIINSNSWYGWKGTITFLYRAGISPVENIIIDDQQEK